MPCATQAILTLLDDTTVDSANATCRHTSASLGDPQSPRRGWPARVGHPGIAGAAAGFARQVGAAVQLDSPASPRRRLAAPSRHRPTGGRRQRQRQCVSRPRSLCRPEQSEASAGRLEDGVAPGGRLLSGVVEEPSRHGVCTVANRRLGAEPTCRPRRPPSPSLSTR